METKESVIARRAKPDVAISKGFRLVRRGLPRAASCPRNDSVYIQLDKRKFEYLHKTRGALKTRPLTYFHSELPSLLIFSLCCGYAQKARYLHSQLPNDLIPFLVNFSGKLEIFCKKICIFPICVLYYMRTKRKHSKLQKYR